jgi:hypothetical protein
VESIVRSKKAVILLSLGVFAGLAYNSWPLGYFINNHIASIFLASNLEATGQPYNWLFIFGDIICGLIILGLAAFYWDRNRHHLTLWMNITLYGFIGFGLLTIVTALLPFNCQESIAQCSVRLTTSFGLHDIIAAVCSICQFFSMFGALFIMFKQKDAVTAWVIAFGALVTITWCAFGILFLMASLTNNSLAVTTQHLFIILTGLAVVLIPVAFNRLADNHKG